MDRSSNDDIDRPLLLAHESTIDENEFYDAAATTSKFSALGGGTSNVSVSSSTVFYSARQIGAAAPSLEKSGGSSPAALSSPDAAAAAPSSSPRSISSSPATATESRERRAPSSSYHGRASLLGTGALFPSARGIVDALPHPTKPCLLCADHDPLAAAAHIVLLEKEAEASADGITLPPHPKHYSLFTTVHVCEPLARRGDAGTRLLKKLKKGDEPPRLPVFLNGGEIFQEGRADGERWWSSTLDCLLPEYIDGAIGKKDLLRPQDAVGFYNMKLFIQRHSKLPYLFHQLLTHPSTNRRILLSTSLLGLLKTINTDLQTFEGSYLCGPQFTLADVYIYPIIELIVVVLSTYRNFWIPPSLTNLIGWYDAVSDRPSVRAAAADRSAESRNTYCFERMHRNEYLIEVYEPLARNEEAVFAQLNDEGGRPGVNVYRQHFEEDVDVRERSICERRSSCESCVIS